MWRDGIEKEGSEEKEKRREKIMTRWENYKIVKSEVLSNVKDLLITILKYHSCCFSSLIVREFFFLEKIQ